jgi:ligand-binding sensor domain-containing protein/signal transduction histidine kinase
MRGLALCGALVLAAHYAAAGEYLVDVWDSESGLPSSTVTALAQTAEGYLWIGTHNGLVRFDGVRFVTFDPSTTPALTHARIANLFVDGAGKLWVNAYDGSLVSWSAGVFQREWVGRGGPDYGAWMISSRGRPAFVLETGDLIRREAGPGAPGRWQILRPPGTAFVPLACEDRTGALWIRSADERLWRLLGDRLEPVPWREGLDGRAIGHLTAGPDGRVWIGTDREVAAWAKDRFEKMTPLDGPSSLDASLVLSVRDGGYWVVAGGRARKARNRRWVESPAACSDLTGAFRLGVRAFEDRQGGVWFAHLGKGLCHVWPDGSAQRIGTADGLPGARIAAFLEDREGNVWVGIDRGGLARLRRRRFAVLSPAEGLSAKAAVSICEDRQGSIWIGTLGGGLDRWRAGALTNLSLPTTTAGGFVFSVYPDRENRLWLSADREDLFILEAGAIRPAALNVHGVKAILVDRRGRVWLGRKDGLSCLEGQRLRTFGPADGIQRTDVRALAEGPDGSIWIGAGDGVVHRFDGGRLETLRPPQAPSQAVWSLLVDDDGTVWVGTFRGGLLRLKDRQFVRYTTRDGLPSDVICQLLDDGLGRLWVGSQQGIFRIAKTALAAFARREIAALPCVRYGRSDGLPTLECSGSYQPAAWRARDGRLWFATTKGVVSVQPREIREDALAPPVVIENVLVDGAEVLPRPITGGREQSQGAVVEIAPDKQRVELRYTGLSLTAPEKVRFRYRLERLEREWIDAASRRWAQYDHLRPGSYRFRLAAANSEGVWSEEEAVLTLVVLPHVWETWWFLGLVGLAVTGAVAGTARHLATRRLRRQLESLERQRAVERDRARIAKDIHDDLGAGLTQISLLSELARNDSPQETDTHLAQISERARELTRTMDEIVWAVNPQHDTLDSLTSYVCRFAQEYLNVAGVQCRLDVPALLPALPLTPEVRHHLFLAVKEALNNVVKHARAHEVWLRLTPLPNGFSLVIEDDGVGVDATDARASRLGSERVSSGQGLDNLARRLDAIGGRCVVQSQPGGGTRVEMTVSLV